MLQYRSPSRIVFNVFNYALFIALSISIIVPFVNAIAISLSDYNAVMTGKIGLLPVNFNWQAYKKLVANYLFLNSILNTVFLTIVNTVLGVTVALCAAYALSHKQFVGRKVAFNFILITMYFSGGLIPTFLLVRSLGLANTYWALILPGMVSTFYIIIYKNMIDQLPKEIMESAEIDGAGEFSLLFRIVLPLVLPMTMAFVIFSAVAHWNEWFGVLLYIKDKSKWTLQFQLREIMSSGLSNSARDLEFAANPGQQIHSENLKMAALMVTVLPIICVYPFLQKYFIHGQFVGAVKG